MHFPSGVSFKLRQQPMHSDNLCKQFGPRQTVGTQIQTVSHSNGIILRFFSFFGGWGGGGFFKRSLDNIKSCKVTQHANS